MTESKEALMTEFLYYGIEVKEEKEIHDSTLSSSVVKDFRAGMAAAAHDKNVQLLCIKLAPAKEAKRHFEKGPSKNRAFVKGGPELGLVIV